MKTILITGATDGLELAVAKNLLAQGHRVLLHGRSREKLDALAQSLSAYVEQVRFYQADLSKLVEVKTLAEQISREHKRLDALINNAGVYVVSETRSEAGIDMRLLVNTVAPYLLTQLLLPILQGGRVVNLSSAAQNPLNPAGFEGLHYARDMEAYAQSKTAITCWTMALAKAYPDTAMIAVNPGSLLATKMVREGFGMAGNNLDQAVQWLSDFAVSERFANISGRYFDGDMGVFNALLAECLDSQKQQLLIAQLNHLTARFMS